MSFVGTITGVKVPDAGSFTMGILRPFLVSGNLYVVGESTASSGSLAVSKSTNGGSTWAEQNSGSRPSITGGLHMVSSILVGTTLHVATTSRRQASGMDFVWQARYHTFDTSTDTWGITNELIVETVSGESDGIGFPAVDIAVRANGEIVVGHVSPETKVMGTSHHSTAVSVRSTGGTWTTNIQVSDTVLEMNDVRLILGESGRVHIVWVHSDALLGDNDLEARTLNSSNGLSTLIDIDTAVVSRRGTPSSLIRWDNGGTKQVFIATGPQARTHRAQEDGSGDIATDLSPQAIASTTTLSQVHYGAAWDPVNSEVHVLWIRNSDSALIRDVGPHGTGFGTDVVVDDSNTYTRGVWANYFDRSGPKIGYVTRRNGTLSYGELTLAAGSTYSETLQTSIVATTDVLDREPVADRDALMAELAPLAWWQLGVDTADLVGNHDLTWNGSPDFVTSGGPIASGKGYVTLDAALEQFAAIANDDLGRRDDMSFEVWVRAADGGTSLHEFFTSYDTVEGVPVWFIIFDNINDRFSLGPTGFATGAIALPLDPPDHSVWQHWVLVIQWNADGTRTMRAYANGNPRWPALVTPAHAAGTGEFNYQPAGTGGTTAIGRGGAGGGSQYFTGDLAEISFYDRVLRPSEVKDLFNAAYFVPEPELEVELALEVATAEDVTLSHAKAFTLDQALEGNAAEDATFSSAQALMLELASETDDAQDVTLLPASSFALDEAEETNLAEDVTLSQERAFTLDQALESDAAQDAEPSPERALALDLAAEGSLAQDVVLAVAPVLAAESAQETDVAFDVEIATPASAIELEQALEDNAAQDVALVTGRAITLEQVTVENEAQEVILSADAALTLDLASEGDVAQEVELAAISAFEAELASEVSVAADVVLTTAFALTAELAAEDDAALDVAVSTSRRLAVELASEDAVAADVELAASPRFVTDQALESEIAFEVPLTTPVVLEVDLAASGELAFDVDMAATGAFQAEQARETNLAQEPAFGPAPVFATELALEDAVADDATLSTEGAIALELANERDLALDVELATVGAFTLDQAQEADAAEDVELATAPILTLDLALEGDAAEDILLVATGAFTADLALQSEVAFEITFGPVVAFDAELASEAAAALDVEFTTDVAFSVEVASVVDLAQDAAFVVSPAFHSELAAAVDAAFDTAFLTDPLLAAELAVEVAFAAEILIEGQADFIFGKVRTSVSPIGISHDVVPIGIKSSP